MVGAWTLVACTAALLVSCSDRGDSEAGADDGFTGSPHEPEPSCEEDIEYCVGCDLFDVVKLGNDRLAKREPTCSQLGADEYECQCDAETRVTVDGMANCDMALNVACELDDADRQTCRIGSALCEAEPEREGAWNCVCDDGSWGSVAGVSCEEAGFGVCAKECDSAAGSCAPIDGQRWRCACDLYGPRTVAAVGLGGCTEILENACEPGHGLSGWGSCTGERGYCDQPDATAPVWQCTCVDGTQESVELGPEVGDEADCGGALRAACGSESDGDRCERESSVGFTSCSRTGEALLADAGAEYEYECICARSCRESVEDLTSSVAANTCVDALDQLCGEDGPVCDE